VIFVDRDPEKRVSPHLLLPLVGFISSVSRSWACAWACVGGPMFASKHHVAYIRGICPTTRCDEASGGKDDFVCIACIERNSQALSFSECCQVGSLLGCDMYDICLFECQKQPPVGIFSIKSKTLSACVCMYMYVRVCVCMFKRACLCSVGSRNKSPCVCFHFSVCVCVCVCVCVHVLSIKHDCTLTTAQGFCV
jgi:hypothetical protein